MKTYKAMPILALVAFSGLAVADRYTPEDATFLATSSQERGAQLQSNFATIDSDRDGRISTQEAAQRPLPDAFWVLDRNRDGYLTVHEYNYRPN